jgi:hypothetical protein
VKVETADKSGPMRKIGYPPLRIRIIVKLNARGKPIKLPQRHAALLATGIAAPQGASA